VDVLVQALAAAQFRNRVLTAQALKNDPNLLFGWPSDAATVTYDEKVGWFHVKEPAESMTTYTVGVIDIRGPLL
jgi:hypothetical protein